MIMMLVLLSGATQGQIPYPSTDTLPCGERQRDYYYSSWYDTCYWYYIPEAANLFPDDGERVARLEVDNWETSLVIQQFADRPIRIKGVWAMVHQGVPSLVSNPIRLPEYIYLYVRDTNLAISEDGKPDRWLVNVASVRWDTAQPKMMCMKQTADERLPKYYCHVYEAMFDTVYTIAGEYWLWGTHNSNFRHDTIMYDSANNYYYHTNIFDNWPTRYVDYCTTVAPVWWVDQFDLYAYPANKPDDTLFTFSEASGPWRLANARRRFFGPYGVILDEQQYRVGLAANDSARGFVRPAAYYPAGTYQTITATARSCYRFSHWNDGDTTNPRTILVTQDTMFTAYFEEESIYDVGVRSNDTAMGHAELQRWYGIHISTVVPNAGNDETHLYMVVGSDTTYCGGDTIRFRAKATPGHYFWTWDDGVRENPRTVTITQDTLVTAIFSKDVPPPYYPPCPRVYKIVPVVEEIGRVRLVWPWSANVLPMTRPQQEGWELAFGPGGTPPDMCRIIQCATPEKLLGGLERGVHYVAYVRTLCRQDDSLYYSDWSDSVGIYFPLNRYTVTAEADYAERGRVYGGGEYDEGAVAVLTANAEPHYSFLQWNDGVGDNPRFVEVTQDTTFTAMFEAVADTEQGIGSAAMAGGQFLLVPNPAREEVRCVLNGCAEAGGVLTVADVAGREVLRKELPKQTQSYTFRVAELPAGTYFVTLVTKEGTATRRLVVE